MGAQCVTERCEGAAFLEQQVEAAAAGVASARDGRVLIEERVDEAALRHPQHQPPALLLTSSRRKPTAEVDEKQSGRGAPFGGAMLQDPGTEAAGTSEPITHPVEQAQLVAAAAAAEAAGTSEPITHPVEQAQLVAAAAAAATAFSGERQPPEVLGRTFELDMTKTDGEEKLGLDVRHFNGKLEVNVIFADGAIARSNRIAKAGNPGGEVLQPGDVINKVNGIEGDDMMMVEECKNSLRLVMHVTRWEHQVQAAQRGQNTWSTAP